MIKKMIIAFLFNSLLVSPFVSITNNYILYDMNTNRVVKESNMNQKKNIASITKIMTLIVAIENGNLDEKVVVKNEDNLIEGSKVYIETNDEILLLDAMYGLMLRSGNDMANLIARTVSEDFIGLMNKKAEELSMTNTTFINPSGLDEEMSNTSTCYDMALLVDYCVENSVFKEVFETKSYTFKTSSEKRYTWVNKHRLLHVGDNFLGGKTGYTKLTGRTLVTTSKDNMVCVTLDCSNDWQVHSDLLKYGGNTISNKLVFEGQIIDYDNLDYIPYVEDIYLLLRNDDVVTEEIVFEKQIGYIYFYVNDELAYQCEIEKCRDVDVNQMIIYVFKVLNA